MSVINNQVCKYKDWIENEISIDCNCGCNRLLITKSKHDKYIDPENISISFVNNYLASDTNRFQRAWRELRGKRTYYAEVILTSEDAIEFLENAIKMIKGEDCSEN